MTRDWFLEVDLAISIGFLYSAKGDAVFGNGVCAFAVIDERRARQFVDIKRRDAFALNGFNTFGGHIWFYLRIYALKDRYFLFVERRPAVALNAAGSLALCQIAAETDVGKIVGYYTVVNN